MFVSLNWLRDFVDLPKNLDADELGKLLTLRSAEVEGVVDQKKAFEGVVIGEMLEFKKHPDADKLHVAKVDVGQKEPLQLIFGAMAEMHVGDRIPVAVAPCTLPTGIEIGKKTLRGIETGGMLCLDQELGLKAEGVDLSYFPNVDPGTPLAEAMGMDDVIIEFDNKALTHRPDLWGHIGIAREIAAITGSKFEIKAPNVDIPTDGKVAKVDVKDPVLCPRFCALIIENIKVAASPDWLKKRLLAVGHGSHNNIVDVTNYVMAETGQPMHAFDKDVIRGGLTIRMAKKNEKLKILDGTERILTEDIGVVTDQEKAVSIAGIIGGENSGINEKTSTIILEAANWDPSILRRASVKLGIRTDAVQRFEKSLDPNWPELAIKRAAEIILEICPSAKITGPMTDISNFEDGEPVITVDVRRVQKKIGVDISPVDMADYLRRLHFGIQDKISEGTQQLTMSVPSFRATKDVDIEDDIVEEVARMYGYENIPAIIPKLPAVAPIFNVERRHKHDAREIFAHALGYTESYNYSFYSKPTIAAYGLDEKSHLSLANYLSEDQSHLRTTLIPNLVQSLREAVKYENGPALFELGHTYMEAGEFMPNEKKFLAAARVFNKKERNPFAYVKGDLELFLNEFHVGKLVFEAIENPPTYMHPYQNAAVSLNGKVLGSVFTLHPVLAEREDFEGKVACFELDFEALSKARRTTTEYKAESKFPSIAFDVSVELDRKVSAAAIEKSLLNALGKNLKSLELFDIYEGDKIEHGKKSLAYSLTLQAEDRTLTNEDLVNAQNSTWAALEKLGGKIRGHS